MPVPAECDVFAAFPWSIIWLPSALVQHFVELYNTLSVLVPACEPIMAPSNYTVLCSKALTHSDVTTEIAKSGRLVLPRAQVVSCLPRLLHLGGAAPASAKARPGGPTPAIPLVRDRQTRRWGFGAGCPVARCVTYRFITPPHPHSLCMT